MSDNLAILAAYLIFISGLLVRIAITISREFKKADWKGILIAFVVGIFGFLYGLDFIEDASIIGGILFSTVGFIAVIAFVFKDRILPRINEGTLLVYGLVSLYILQIFPNSQSLLYVISMWALLIYCLIIFALCMKRFRVNSFVKIFLYVFFLLLSILILWVLFPSDDFSLIYLFFAGYASFPLITNLLFVLFFIPIPSRHKTFKERLSEIRNHSKDLENKYIDIDIGVKRTLLIVCIGGALYLNYRYFFIGDVLTIVLALLIGEFVTKVHPKKKMLLQ